MADIYAGILEELGAVQRDSLSITLISEPISSAINQGGGRGSDASQIATESPTPSSLETDLTHYKELFSKLRFSYLEQVTKEKFLRAIVSDPPLLVEHKQNEELEAQLVEAKAALRVNKVEVADMVEKLGKQARELSQRHGFVLEQTTLLKTLPGKIEELEASIAALKAAQAPGPNASLNMSLEKTIALVEMKEKETEDLDRLLEKLQAELPRRTRALERAETELQPIEMKRLGSMSAAKEARRRKEEALDGIGDDLEERGRWWRGVESGLKVMLEVEK